MQFACSEIATKQISSVLVRNVSRPFSAHYCYSWCKLRFSNIFSTPWLHVERHLSAKWSFMSNVRILHYLLQC